MRLNAIESGPAHATALPAILIHGLFGQARNLGRLQRRLAVTRRTLALDLRSHGDSPHGPLDLRRMAEDVGETMHAAAIGRATVVGHSLGGKVAMALALQSPALVAGLLVADIAPAAYDHGNIRFARALQRLELRPGLTRAEADAALAAAVEEPAVRTLLLQNLHTGERPRWRIGLDEIAGSLDQAEGWPDWPDGAAYGGPALFLRGGNSDYVLPAHTPAIRTLFPRARMATLRDAGHWLHVDKPDEFNAVVMGFVEARDPAGTGETG